MELKERLELLLEVGEYKEEREGGSVDWKYTGVSSECVGNPRPITKEEKELVDFMGGNYDRELARLYFEKRPATVLQKFAKMTQVLIKVLLEWRKQEAWPEDLRTRGKILRKAVNDLGPAFIKCGQTLSARSDLIGTELAGELAELQNNTEPFSTEEAMRNMADSFEWDGPIAPGVPGPWKGNERECKPGDYLFKELSKEPIASASLGQVYKGKTWEGDVVAVKVQRPEILCPLLLDMYVLRLGLVALRVFWGSDTDLTPIADEVAAGVWNELDYRQEAANAMNFEEAHRFLPYIKVPRYIMEYTTERVLTMEWVDGKKLGQLELDKQLDFMAKAIEASGAMLLQTGLVHADPHEGNILYDEKNGDLVFIDFGLVSTVHPRLMEAFASGVINLITMDWAGFAEDFKNMELVPEDENGNSLFSKLNEETKEWESCDIKDFTFMLGNVMDNAEMQDFGDLVICVQQMADNYKFLCPPYTILLVRTFATLEGLAAKCDASFNMYEACLPYAVRRGLAPTTEEGKKELRDTLINSKGEFAFENFQESIDLIQRMQVDEEEGQEKEEEPSNITSAITGRAPEIVGSLATAPEGSTIRTIMTEADTVAFVSKVLNVINGEMLAVLVSMLAASIQRKIVSPSEEDIVKIAKEPVSQESSRALKKIAGKHLSSLVTSGPKGITLLLRVALLSSFVFMGGLFRGSLGSFFLAFSNLFSRMSQVLNSVSKSIISHSSV